MSTPLTDERLAEVDQHLDAAGTALTEMDDYGNRSHAEWIQPLALGQIAAKDLRAEVDRLKEALIEAETDHDAFIERLTRMIPEEYDSDAAVESTIVRWAQDQVDGWKKVREAHQPCPFGADEGCDICEVLDGQADPEARMPGRDQATSTGGQTGGRQE